MELTQIRYFIKVAESENITATAKKLFISQPALSTAINRLEADIGVKLFKRYNNKIVLTSAGKLFLESSKKSLEILDNSIKEVRSLSTTLKSSYTVVSAFGITDHIMNAFLKDNSGININIILDNNRLIHEKIIKEDADFGLSLSLINDSNLNNRCIMQGRFCAAFPKGTIINRINGISIEELSKYRLFCSKLGDTKKIVEKMFIDKGIAIEIIELDAKDFLFEAAAKGLGVVLCMPMLYDRHRRAIDGTKMVHDDSVEFLPISDFDTNGEVYLVTKKGRPLTNDLEQIINFTSDYFHKNDVMLANLVCNMLNGK